MPLKGRGNLCTLVVRIIRTTVGRSGGTTAATDAVTDATPVKGAASSGILAGVVGSRSAKKDAGLISAADTGHPCPRRTRRGRFLTRPSQVNGSPLAPFRACPGRNPKLFVAYGKAGGFRAVKPDLIPTLGCRYKENHYVKMLSVQKLQGTA